MPATPGWIPADFHVHSAESFDSALPLARQLVAFAANGGELMVSSEHDRVIDPAPTVARLGLGDRIRALGGVEITTAFPGGETPHTIGHWNAFPLRRDPDAYRGGAPAAEGRRPREVIAELWDPAGPPIVQLNHPRGNDGAYEDQRYLTHLGVVGKPYDPARPFEVLPNRVLVERDPATGLRDLDFDAVELLNGASLPGYRLVRADWLSWLLQGEFRTGTGNSDSHRAGEVPALPRNYLRSAAATPAEIQPADVVSAVHRGQLWATTGPLLDVSLSGKGLGELHTGQSGLLRVHVDAAPWVPVAELRVLVDGALVARQEIAAGDTRELPLAFAHDSFVTVEVQGPREGVYAEILPGFTPFAFTNPIFVDADGDGHWSAPGLGSAPPPAISDPLAP